MQKYNRSGNSKNNSSKNDQKFKLASYGSHTCLLGCV